MRHLRASKELETIGIKSGEIIINGILPEEVCEIEFFRKKFDSQQKVIRETESAIAKPKRYMLLRDNEVKGINALTDVAVELFATPGNGKHMSFPQAERACLSGRQVGNPSEEKDYGQAGTTKKDAAVFRTAPIGQKSEIDRLFLPSSQTKAIFFTGKGGVGKTSISCITALYIARKGIKTLLVTTDPAAHIGEVLDVKIGSRPEKITDNLFAVMVDQQEAFREYKERVLSDARGKYSEDMLATMEEELNSPCTEEMAAFDKFIQYIQDRDYEVVVFDTAPTGHTLRLLDLPFDYARQVEMMAGSAENAEAKDTARNRFRDIIDTLRDKKRTVFSLVLYPESTPIMESYRAMLDLKEAGIETQLVVANMVLPEEACTNNFFRSRRQMQLKYLREIKDRFNLPVLSFPLLQEEIKGLNHLNMAASNF